jgi:hypothetical protein
MYTNIYIYFLSYFAELFLEWEMFQTKVVEKIKTHILCSVTFFRKPCRLWDNVEKHGRVGQTTNVQTARALCTLDTLIYMQTPRISNTYRFSTTITIARTRLDVTLHVFLIIITLKAKHVNKIVNFEVPIELWITKRRKENIIQRSLHAGVVLFLKTLLLGWAH